MAVMYAGEIVELAPTKRFSKGLSSLCPGAAGGVAYGDRTASAAPFQARRASPMGVTVGCRFAPRCPKAQEVCRTIRPPRVDMSSGHEVLCHFPAPTTQS